MKKKNQTSIEEQYKKLTQYEHILSRPDTYVGSLEFQKERLGYLIHRKINLN